MYGALGFNYQLCPGRTQIMDRDEALRFGAISVYSSYRGERYEGFGLDKVIDYLSKSASCCEVKRSFDVWSAGFVWTYYVDFRPLTGHDDGAVTTFSRCGHPSEVHFYYDEPSRGNVSKQMP